MFVNSVLLRILSVLLVVAIPCFGRGEKLKSENVFLIMSDGLRWQEVFRGAEEGLINGTTGGVVDTNSLRKQFMRPTVEERRSALLPFFWSEIAQHGQLFGNTNLGSIAKVINGKKFSYPGYNETITGAPDPRIKSNDKIPNPNTNVFEWLNLKPRFANRVAIVGNWDAFPYIFNSDRSGLPIWPAWGDKFARNPIPVSTELETVYNDATPLWHGCTLDTFIFNGAIEHVKAKRPKVTFIGFGETDEWAHGRRYDLYLTAANHVDSFVSRLWKTVQSTPKYRNKTTLIITCDHGRGGTEKDWTDHGGWVTGAEYIWLAVVGPDTPALGERKNCGPIGQNQIAATLAAFLGEDYHATFPQTGAPIADVFEAP